MDWCRLVFVECCGVLNSSCCCFLRRRDDGSCLAKGKHEDADRLYQRALAIYEQVYGQGHPEVAITLSNQVRLLQKQVSLSCRSRYAQFHGIRSPDSEGRSCFTS